LMVEHLAELWRRYAPIREVMRGRPAGGIAPFATCGSSVSSVWLEPCPIDTLVTIGRLRGGLEPQTAADLMWVRMSPDVYLRLVGPGGAGPWPPTASG
jgi:hypothetical protein